MKYQFTLDERRDSELRMATRSFRTLASYSDKLVELIGAGKKLGYHEKSMLALSTYFLDKLFKYTIGSLLAMDVLESLMPTGFNQSDERNSYSNMNVHQRYYVRKLIYSHYQARQLEEIAQRYQIESFPPWYHSYLTRAVDYLTFVGDLLVQQEQSKTEDGNETKDGNETEQSETEQSETEQSGTDEIELTVQVPKQMQLEKDRRAILETVGLMRGHLDKLEEGVLGSERFPCWWMSKFAIAEEELKTTANYLEY